MRPTTISALELVQKHFEPIRWAIPGLLPAGVSLVVGPPKTGKSWLVMNIAIANASGGFVLGCIQVDPGRVLYLALEDNERRLKSRLEKLLNGAATPDGLHFATEWPRLDNGAVECIEEHLTHYPDTRLIVIDTLAKTRPNTKGRDNLYEQDYAVGSPLLQLAGKHGLAIVLVHSPERRRVYDLIAEHGPIHGREIASAIHPGIEINKQSKEWGSVRFLLKKLVDEGLVIVTDHGYSVNGDKNITHTPNPAHNAHTPHTATPPCNAMTV